MRITQGAGACAVLAIAIAACGGNGSSSSGSPTQLLADGAKALTALQSEQVTGTFTIDSINGSLQASVLHNGEISGTINLGDSESPFVYIAGTTYWETLATFVLSTFPTEIGTLAQLIKGQPWWQTTGSTEAAAVIQLLRPGGLQSAFLTGRSGLTESQGKDSTGRAATVLTDSEGSVYIANASPYNVLEVKTAAHYLAGRFSALDFTFNEFNAPVTVTAPTDFLIPDVTHMPGFFYVKGVDLKDCNSSGCTASAVVQPEAGSGMTTVTLTISDSAGAKLAVCTDTVDVPSYTSTPTAQCRAHSAAWTDWWDTANGATYTVVGTINNPAYTLTG
jgi:hypothetical protein